MRIAFFDCFSGISGDMTLGALLHAGLDEAAWRAELAKLNVPGYEIKTGMVVKEGISAMDVDVVLTEEDQGHGRHLKDIADILEASGVSPSIHKRAMGAFGHLACAEAKIHAMTPDTIHFHEVGAIDAIVDIVGACIGLEMLGIERVYVSPLPFNRGWVDCAHGTMPVPAPATLELLAGFPFRPDQREKELITPTGAALLNEYAERTPSGELAPLPPFVLQRIGYGAGKRDSWIPNLLRVLIGDISDAPVLVPAGTKRL
jgi:pyridinium-3,5-bisthiocarboxylic acid mononucleotide nickel chelatase